MCVVFSEMSMSHEVANGTHDDSCIPIKTSVQNGVPLLFQISSKEERRPTHWTYPRRNKEKDWTPALPIIFAPWTVMTRSQDTYPSPRRVVTEGKAKPFVSTPE